MAALSIPGLRSNKLEGAVVASAYVSSKKTLGYFYWSVTDVICTLTAPEGHSMKTQCVTKSSTIALGNYSVKQILMQVMARSCFPSALPIHGQICP